MRLTSERLKEVQHGVNNEIDRYFIPLQEKFTILIIMKIRIITSTTTIIVIVILLITSHFGKLIGNGWRVNYSGEV